MPTSNPVASLIAFVVSLSPRYDVTPSTVRSSIKKTNRKDIEGRGIALLFLFLEKRIKRREMREPM